MIEEASKKPRVNSITTSNYQESMEVYESNVPSEINQESTKYLEYKIDNINMELANIKNLFIQAMMEDKVNPKDIEDIKIELSNMKQMMDLRSELDVSKEIRDEIESVKAITENLSDIQKENNEKVRRFIEEYRKRRG